MKYKKLRKIMSQKGRSINELSKETEISCMILYLKLWGFSEFKAWEILLVSRALSLTHNQIEDIFFGSKSFSKETNGGKGYGNYRT